MDYFPALFVPILIFAGGTVFAIIAAGMGIDVMVEAKKRTAAEIGRTASYAEPFTDSHGRG